ncbi:acyl-CoA dehydrogenase family protein [Georgenia sp. SYP-B2076]|uniref:acyl-CoA dehydrogenase family protein n=1 Tax=Georgenia sp. SYP-B2076 TaxID=2495881 RepID=UPI000F8D1578|nr:acyl-CoA dehydrogenase family protein [Georgenia sp. SYP-B2076]
MASDDVEDLIGSVRTAVEGVTGRWDRDYYREKTRTGDAPVEMYAAMAEQGLFALGVPEEHGGAGGGLVATAAAMEAMSEAGMPPLLFSLTSFARQAILHSGSSQQVTDHVVPSLTAERTFSFAMTEPEAGTNSFAMRTRADRQADGSYRVNGQKVFISGADQADHMLLVARTTPAESVERKADGISLFVLPRDTAGVSMDRMAIDWKAPEKQFSVWFDDVLLPPEALVGEEGKGVAAMFQSLNSERVVIAAWTLGLGTRAVAKAVAYARERAPWGAPIGSYQSVAHPLARAKAQLVAARLVTYEAARVFDAGGQAGDLSNVAKYLASEASYAAVDAALQAHGGSAFDEDSDIVTLWPMIRLLRIAPLNNEMVLNYIAEHILGLPRSY